LPLVVGVAESRTGVFSGADLGLALSTALLLVLVLVVALLLRPVVIVSALPHCPHCNVVPVKTRDVSCSQSLYSSTASIVRRNRIAMLGRRISIRARHANTGDAGHELARSQGCRQGPVQSSEARAVDAAVSHAHPFDVERSGGGCYSARGGRRAVPTEDPGDSSSFPKRPLAHLRTGESPSQCGCASLSKLRDFPRRATARLRSRAPLVVSADVPQASERSPPPRAPPLPSA
jgi:hypothetical protein